MKRLFKKKGENILKPGGMEESDMLIDVFNNNHEAYLDSKSFLLQDIPTKFQNMNTFKLHKAIMAPELKFYTNAPISIFIASHLKEAKVLDSSWKDT